MQRKPTKQAPTEIMKVLMRLEAKGLIRRNGEFRDGRPVFVITELGKLLPPDAGVFREQ
jgi:DNA-binding PadR family transcriptional regulator